MIKEFYELFKEYSQIVGLDDNLESTIAFAFLCLLFLAALLKYVYKGVKAIIWYYQRKILNKDLHPYFTNKDVINATKFYIETKYQNVSPSEDEEPNRRYIASAKNDLIPLFLNKIFPVRKSDHKYYLILADSGMGKTTFLINLYIRQKNKIGRWFKIKPYDIKLVPIWHPSSLDSILKVEKPEQTILLLDAFDENIEAQKDYEKVLRSIINETSNFRIVVITCRTQFFPSQKEEPHETGYFTAGEAGEQKFQKLYLSVFDNEDVKRYLKKRFNRIFERRKYLKANRIVAKCPNLVIRPMLLNHINDLLHETKEYVFSFQVYEELISTWIRREARKIGIKEKYGSERSFIRTLYRFSENLAIDIYRNKEKRKGLYIPTNYEFKEGKLSIEDFDIPNDEMELDQREAKSKSLLTRNSLGEYKFSHKSILEYFLARSIFFRHLLFEDFDFSGMSMVKKFHSEMVLNKIKREEGCFYSIVDNGIERKQSIITQLELKSVDRVKELYIENIISIRPIELSIFKNLKTLIVFDLETMSLLYKIYLFFQEHFQKVQDSIEAQQFDKNFKTKIFLIIEELDTEHTKKIKKHLETLNNDKLKKILFNLNINEGIDEFYKTHKSNIYNEIHLKKEMSSKTELEKIQRQIEELYLFQQAVPECKIFF